MELLIDDKFLRTTAKPIGRLTSQDTYNIQEMFRIMYDNKGIGLAATQVGWDARVFITDINNDPKIFINPWITVYGNKKIIEEEG